MSQPIYVVKRERVLYWINHLASFGQYRVESLAWGEVGNIQILIDAVNSLERYPNDTINMSRLACCINSFHTSKMPACANRALKGLWDRIKSERETLV